MIKLKLVIAITILSVVQISIAELNSKTIDMDAVNKAHTNINQNQEKKAGHSDGQEWTKDQLKQAKLEKDYKATIATNPKNKKTYAYLAGLYLSNNMTSKAIEAYQEAIIHDPTNPKLFAAISIAYLHKAKYGMAKAMADEALRLDPKLKGVEKINEYVEAKQKAIKDASKDSKGSIQPVNFSAEGLHGSVMPKALGEKPVDRIHVTK